MMRDIRDYNPSEPTAGDEVVVRRVDAYYRYSVAGLTEYTAGRLGVVDLTGPTDLSASLNPATGETNAYTNTGATANITITLPDATIGRAFLIRRTHPIYSITVDCQFSDHFEGGSNGESVTLETTGGVLFQCTATDKWSMVTDADMVLSRAHDAGRTIYMATTGSDSNDGLTVGAPKLTLKGACSALRPGDTLTIASGTYTGASNALTPANIPRGTVDNWITIKATTLFGAVFTGGVSLTTGSKFSDVVPLYLRIDGIVFKDTATKSIQMPYIKFLQCAFHGAPASGNYSTVEITGALEQTTINGAYYQTFKGAHHVLMEDCVAFGEGGRHCFLVYGVDSVILRRCLGRWDGGWTASGGYIARTFCVYDSANAELQNCLAIDALGTSTNYEADFRIESNYYQVENVAFRGCIAINNAGTSFVERSFMVAGLSSDTATYPSATVRHVNRLKNIEIENCAAADLAGTGLALYAGPVEVRNCTFVPSAAGGKFGIYSYTDTQRCWGNSIHNNVVVYYNVTADYSYPTDANTAWDNYSVTGANLTAALAAAATAGLQWLPKIDYGGTIDSSPYYAGATIVKRIGAAETLHGDMGYKRLGWDSGSPTDDLWPWPNQAEIKTMMQAHESAARDWTAGSDTLTQYIWGILGTAAP